MAVARPLKIIYLGFMLLAVVFIQIGIRTGQRPDMVLESAKEESGYVPMAQKIERAKALMAEAEAEVLNVASGPPIEGEMVPIPAGVFLMGSLEGPMDQQPQKKIYLDAYRIDKHEVTFAQFYQFVAATGNRKPRLAGYLAVDSSAMHLLMKPTNPVAGVSWVDAGAYCEWKGKRLLTEAEWEKAAKGSDQRRWTWGDEELPVLSNLAGADDGFPFLAPVGTFFQDRSPYGVYGMIGNVMEWVSDWYQEDAYRTNPSRNPKGPSREGFRLGPERDGFKVVRGGSWNDSIRRAETTIRFRVYPEYRDVTIGFRCGKQG